MLTTIWSELKVGNKTIVSIYRVFHRIHCRKYTSIDLRMSKTKVKIFLTKLLLNCLQLIQTMRKTCRMLMIFSWKLKKWSIRNVDFSDVFHEWLNSKCLPNYLHLSWYACAGQGSTWRIVEDSMEEKNVAIQIISSLTPQRSAWKTFHWNKLFILAITMIIDAKQSSFIFCKKRGGGKREDFLNLNIYFAKQKPRVLDDNCELTLLPGKR